MKRVFLQVCLLAAAGVAALGCNALTEPTKFDVVKEKQEPTQKPADDDAEPAGAQQPAQPGAATRPTKAGVPVDPAKADQMRQAAAKIQQQKQAQQKQAPQAPGGSCGE